MERSLKTRNRAHTREDILKAAHRLFVERGYAAASIREITRLAGVNESLVARYFGSKQRLFIEAVLGVPSAASAKSQATRGSSFDVMRSGALSAIVRSAASEEPRSAIKLFLQQSGMYLVEMSPPGGRPEALAALTMALALGVRLMRDVFDVEALATVDAGLVDELCARLMTNLNAAVSETTSGVASGDETLTPLDVPVHRATEALEVAHAPSAVVTRSNGQTRGSALS